MKEYEVFRITSTNDARLIEEILLLENEAFGEAGLNRFSLPLFLLFGYVFVLYVRGKFAGVSELIRSCREGEVFLWGISIKKEYRNKGYGKKFLDEVLKKIPKETKSVYLTVAKDNFVAKKIYGDLGFSLECEKKDLFGKKQDRLIFKKEL